LGAISIYTAADPEQLGRTSFRSEVTSRSLDSFQRSIPLASPDEGHLTAVVLDREVGEFLMDRLKSGSLKGEGFRIYRQEGLIGIEDNRYGLEILFSLEKASPLHRQVVEDFYADDPYWQGAVLERYLNNYVIRIWQGDGAIAHEGGKLLFSEALLLATLIGDESQWLWGIHDGEGYLFSLLQQWYRYNENTPETEGLSLPYPNDGTAIPGFLDPNNVFIPLEERQP